MLSKIISFAPTREEAIDILADGLDNYVIEGVQHNARLVNAVLRHPVFRAGNTPTSFLPTHIPKFEGVELTSSQEEELAVAIALISKDRESVLQRPPVSSSSDSPIIVRLGGLFGKAFSVKLKEDSNVAVVTELSQNGTESERQVTVDSLRSDPDNCLAHVSLDGSDRAIQVIKEKVSGELKVQMYGADMECLVQNPREYELSSYMQPPKVVDTSDFVMSPMPGTLISFSVEEGDHVEMGQELCVVEAMKMQNQVRAPREGRIGKINVKAGAALVTDQVIIEYDTESGGEEAA